MYITSKHSNKGGYTCSKSSIQENALIINESRTYVTLRKCYIGNSGHISPSNFVRRLMVVT